MKWPTPLVRFVVRFQTARIAVSNTVRAGYALGPKGTRAVVVRFVARFGTAKPQPSAIRDLVFPHPARPARKGSPAGGGVVPPLGGDPPPSTPAVRVCRRAADAVALIAWRHAPSRLRNRPRFRDAVLTAAARAANS